MTTHVYVQQLNDLHSVVYAVHLDTRGVQTMFAYDGLHVLIQSLR